MKKIVFYLVFFVNLSIILYFWFGQSGDLLLNSQAGFFVSLGRICGLLAVYFILWQLVLIGRIKFLEQSFGFDRLAIWHHFNGLLAWLFIFLHPLFLAIGHSQINQVSFLQQILDFLFSWDDLAPAYLAVGVFLIVIIISIGAIQKKLKYEIWYLIHLLTYLAIIWSFGHQLELGSDLQNLFFAAYWYLLYVLAVIPLIYFRFLKPLYFFYQHRFQVEKIENESDQVISIYIKGQNLEKFKFQGGQFAIFRFLGKNLFFEAHPFSFSSAFNGQSLRITIKNLGDFTGSLKNKLKSGTFILIDGPHGIFTKQRTENKKIALIAGGIGITPLRALVEDSLKNKTNQEIVLFYAVAKETDLVLRSELDSLQNNFSARLKIIYILSQVENWPGEKGRFDEEKLKRILPGFADYDFYLCGPPLMIKNIKMVLKKQAIKSRKIYYEKFSLN